MKGKKFDAAEKHFKEKEFKLIKEINRLSSALLQQSQIGTDLVMRNHILQQELNQLKEKYDKLLEYSKLSEQDIQTALQKDKAIANFSGVLGVMGNYLSR